MNDLAPTFEHTITPPRRLIRINWQELWRYRELFAIFVWRDVKVRYKQTVLGVAWAIFQPFVTMVIFTAFFSKVAHLPSDGIPYPVFAYAGLLFWNYYMSALTNATNCLVDNEGIIKKVYFPRLVLPVSTAITPLIDFGAALVVLFGLMAYYHYPPHILGIIALPLLLATSTVAASGLGLFLSSFNVKFRDVRYILPFFLQLLLYVTPVIYPISLIPQRLQWLLYLNPMTGVISVARALILGNGSVDWGLAGISALTTVAMFFVGVAYFRKTEQFFADII